MDLFKYYCFRVGVGLLCSVAAGQAVPLSPPAWG